MQHIYLPSVRIDQAIVRTKLLATIQEAISIGNKMVVLAAPAGFGKTTLMAQYAQQVRAQNGQVVWLNCSNHHTSEAALLEDLVTAAQQNATAQEHFQPAHQRNKPLWGSNQDPLLICLDNFEQTKSASLDDWLGKWLLTLPAHVNCLISTREITDTTMTRLELAGLAKSLYADQLRMNPQEAHQILGVDLDGLSKAQAIEYAHGWAFALQLIRLKAAGQRDWARPDMKNQVPRHQIFEYLSHEVMSYLEPQALQFLTDTSIFESIDAEVVSALLGNQEWKAIIHKLRHLSPVLSVNESSWRIQLHPLLRDFLLNRATHIDHERVKQLRIKSSEILYGNGAWEDASEQALLAGEPKKAAELLQKSGGIRLIATSGAMRCLTVLQKLPQDQIRQHPRLRMMRLGIQILQKNPEGTQSEFFSIQQDIEANRGDDETLIDLALLKAILLVHATEKDIQANPWSAIAQIRKDLEQSQISDPRIKGIVWPIEIYLYQKYGLTGQAIAKTNEIKEWFREYPRNLNEAWLSIYQAKNLMSLGRIKEAEIKLVHLLKQEDHPVGRRDRAMAQVAQALLVQICLHQRHQAAAQRYIEEIQEESHVRLLDVLLAVHVAKARIQFEQGHIAQALTTLEHGQQMGEDENLSVLSMLASFTQCEFYARLGQIDLASKIASKRNLLAIWNQAEKSEPLPWPLIQSMAHALYWLKIQEQNRSEALGIVGSYMAMSSRCQMRLDYLHGQLMNHTLMEADQIQGETLLDLALMALDTGSTAWMNSIGQRLYPALNRMLATSKIKDDQRIQLEQIMREWILDIRNPQAGISSVLTPREIDILRAMMIESHSKWVARKLDISVETVKHHLKNIFLKLEVHTREEAISVATAKGLLD